MDLNKLGFAVKKGVCCVLLPCFFAFTFSGCSNNGNFALKCGEHEMSSEEFTYVATNTIFSAPYKIDTSSVDMSSQSDIEKVISEGSIEGQPAADWIKEQSIKTAKNLLTARQECKKLNKEVPDDYKQNAKSQIDTGYDDSHLGDLNVSKEALQQYLEDYKCIQMVNEEYFGKDKPKYIDDERVDQYTKEHGLKYKIVELNKILDSSNFGEEFKKTLKNEGVSSIKELATKYMDQIAKGKTIDEIDAAFNKLFGAGQTAESSANSAEQNFVFKYDEDSESDETKFVTELSPGSAPVLKEDEKAYYIIQRFELDQPTIEKQREGSRNLLSANEFKNFLDELTDKCEITVNKEIVDKFNVLDQTKLISDVMKKIQEDKTNKMSQDNDDDLSSLDPDPQDAQEKSSQSQSQSSQDKSSQSQSQSSQDKSKQSQSQNSQEKSKQSQSQNKKTS